MAGKGKHKRLTPHELAMRNPVRAAIGRTRIASHLRSVRIQMFTAEADRDETELIARLCWVLSLGAEIELAEQGRTERLRRVHAALRHVHAMCQRGGYRWVDTDLTWLDAAVVDANEAALAAPWRAVDFIPGCDQMAQAIREHRADAWSVAGAEIYNQQPHEVAA